MAREWAITYAGAPKKQVAEGSGGATDASLKEQERKVKEEEARDALAAYGHPTPDFHHPVSKLTCFLIGMMDITRISSTASVAWDLT